MKIYGPVPSWRLGDSLGVDIVEVPKNYEKICSFDCMYCQLGSKWLKARPSHFPIGEKDFYELKKRIDETKPDYITFSGSGEPTLNLDLGKIADKIKSITSIPVALLTNASFVNDKIVRENMDTCDIVIAKIDAATQQMFEKINKPIRGINLKEIVGGIKQLKAKVAVQTLLFSHKNFTNADDESINGLIKIYKEINRAKPISVFLGTAYRPTALKDVETIPSHRLEQIASKIKDETGIEVTYYKKNQPRPMQRELARDEFEKEIINILTRRPCTIHDLEARFGKIDNVLDELLARGLLVKKNKEGKEFFSLK